ncbi:CMGC/MAPK protein kinase, variant 1 [Aphanomyces invadans]|uniref:Mitogen-activated protein kinase n=1 Tax=Aphanomyces invadans TaxID=157072 RepID=A0A024UUR5_9STRA|nr:CMGC/MAPK protein kinase, variant 1 [Aphanomyces invadans]ETW09700.1 CMGC/MAPK protein kinase, variant 1 [Aphanomyces invadans]|eukprot:XP_008861111.1 CMGC/MAPK protein kinase, variant 1 [Aphanomyces invadans]
MQSSMLARHPTLDEEFGAVQSPNKDVDFLPPPSAKDITPNMHLKTDAPISLSLSLSDGQHLGDLLAKHLTMMTVLAPLPQWQGVALARVNTWGPQQVLLQVEQLQHTDQVRLILSSDPRTRQTRQVERSILYRILRNIQERLQPEEKVPQRPRRQNSTFDDDKADVELASLRRQPLEPGDLEEKEDVSSPIYALPRTPVSCVPEELEFPPATPPPVPLHALDGGAVDCMATENFDDMPTRKRSNTLRYLINKDAFGGIAFEGYLSKKGDLLAAWKSCYCVLEGLTLAIYDSREDFMADAGLKVRVILVDVNDDVARPHGFAIKTEGHKTLHLASRTAFEQEQWVRAIRLQLTKGNRLLAEDYVAFGSQPMDVPVFYSLLSSLLREEISDFPLLCRSIHPDVLLTSNYPPIVPFWGQYRRYDGLLLFISALLETVDVESFEMADCVQIMPDKLPTDCLVPASPAIPHTKRLVVTGKETLAIKQPSNADRGGGDVRRVTQLFVHELWLDYKDRLVRWHVNGDSVALSVAFDACDKGKGLRLILPGETSAIHQSIPAGTFYVQLLKAHSLGFVDGPDKNRGVYVRCVLDEGTHIERTLDGLKTKESVDVRAAAPSPATRLLRGIQRVTGTSMERPFAAFGDKSGCVTQIVYHTDAPEWNSNVRLAFPGCPRGGQYFLRIEVYQSRFMKSDVLIGVCKVNLSPHMALLAGSAEAKATGALSRWYNLCDIYNDCKEWWAPPTVFRGKIQMSIVFAPHATASVAVNDAPVYPAADHDATERMREYFSTQDKMLTASPGSMHGLETNMPSLLRSVSISDVVQRDNYVIMGKKSLFDIPKRYQVIKVLGSGSYGEVIAASDTHSGASVAIKKVPQAFRELLDTKRILREVCLLRQLRHPHLIRLWDVLRPTRCLEMEDIYLVTDLMETDLHRVIHSTQTLSDQHVGYFMLQIFRALKYLHSANIFHRDLKPSNILLTTQCEVKICDLGLARSLEEMAPIHENLTEYVVTRWYRAPEVLLDGSRYGASIDMWSAGCILAEMLGRKPLFPGSSTVNQLGKIFNVLGTPSPAYVNQLLKPAAQRWVQKQTYRPALAFSELYPQTNTLALDLLSKLLTFDPKARLTADQALAHPYITSIGLPYDGTMDIFVGSVDSSHENVPEVKEDMQRALFDQDVPHAVSPSGRLRRAAT